MPASAPPARPTPEQLATAGRIWKRALARQAQAMLWMGVGYSYPLETMDRFAELPWEELGAQTQEDIARELFAFLGVVRGESRR